MGLLRYFISYNAYVLWSKPSWFGFIWVKCISSLFQHGHNGAEGQGKKTNNHNRVNIRDLKNRAPMLSITPLTNRS